MEEDFQVGSEADEITLRKLGNLIKDKVPPGMGFALLMFDYGKKGDMFYISSAKRSDMIAAMKEFIEKNDY